MRLRGADRAGRPADRGRGRRGRAGRLGGVRTAKVGEDGLHGEGILDGGEDAQAAATAGTREDIEGEGSFRVEGLPGAGPQASLVEERGDLGVGVLIQ